MNKKVAFDIGNVLFRVDLEPFVIAMKEDVGEEAYIFLDSIQAAQDIGLFTMFQALVNHGIHRARAEYLSKIWLNTIILSQTTMDFLKELDDEGYEIVLFSNIGLDHKDYLIKNCPELGLCLRNFSCDIGVRKPSKLFFQNFLKDRVGWHSLVYFDDKSENFEQIWDSPIICTHFDLREYKTDKEGVDILRNRLRDMY